PPIVFLRNKVAFWRGHALRVLSVARTGGRMLASGAAPANPNDRLTQGKLTTPRELGTQGPHHPLCRQKRLSPEIRPARRRRTPAVLNQDRHALSETCRRFVSAPRSYAVNLPNSNHNPMCEELRHHLSGQRATI